MNEATNANSNRELCPVVISSGCGEVLSCTLRASKPGMKMMQGSKEVGRWRRGCAAANVWKGGPRRRRVRVRSARRLLE